jgi:hypothetical protein
VDRRVARRPNRMPLVLSAATTSQDLTRLFDHREIGNGNRESLRGFFFRDAIIVWHVKSFKRKRRRIRQWRDDPAAPPVIWLTSARQAEEWLNELREGALDF